MAARLNRPRLKRRPVEWCNWRQRWPAPDRERAADESQHALAMAALAGLKVPNVART